MLRLTLLLALCALVACARDPQQASAPQAVPAAVPPDAREVFNNRTAALLARTLADDSDAAWLGRLEAIRQARRERPARLAQCLVERAERSRSDLEQAAAIDALAAAYPDQAVVLAPRLAKALAGEPGDERRLAVSLLRYRLVPCYALALDLLMRGDHAEALFAARSLVIAAGPAIVPELRRRAAGLGDLPALAGVLASAAAGAGDSVGDAAHLGESTWPRAAVAAFAEHYRTAAIPALRVALAAPACDGRAEAVAALGELGDSESTSEILRQLPQTDLRERPAFLLALGRLKSSGALPELLAASRDATEARGEDGGTNWPLAQAALAGLARMPGEEPYDALISALARTARPLVSATAALALAERGERAALPALEEAVAALVRDGHAPEAAAAADARDRLAGAVVPLRDVLAYVLRYHGPGGTFAIVADQPLLPVDGAGRVLRATIDGDSVTQESIALSHQDVAAAIQLRNSRKLDRVAFAGEPVDEVDLLAR